MEEEGLFKRRKRRRRKDYSKVNTVLTPERRMIVICRQFGLPKR